MNLNSDSEYKRLGGQLPAEIEALVKEYAQPRLKKSPHAIAMRSYLGYRISDHVAFCKEVWMSWGGELSGAYDEFWEDEGWRWRELAVLPQNTYDYNEWCYNRVMVHNENVKKYWKQRKKSVRQRKRKSLARNKIIQAIRSNSYPGVRIRIYRALRWEDILSCSELRWKKIWLNIMKLAYRYYQREIKDYRKHMEKEKKKLSMTIDNMTWSLMDKIIL